MRNQENTGHNVRDKYVITGLLLNLLSFNSSSMKGGKKLIHFILFHHPPNIIKNPPSNVSKRIKNLPIMQQ